VARIIVFFLTLVASSVGWAECTESPVTVTEVATVRSSDVNDEKTIYVDYGKFRINVGQSFAGVHFESRRKSIPSTANQIWLLYGVLGEQWKSEHNVGENVVVENLRTIGGDEERWYTALLAEHELMVLWLDALRSSEAQVWDMELDRRVDQIRAEAFHAHEPDKEYGNIQGVRFFVDGEKLYEYCRADNQKT